jgi:hypothetical protein
VHEDAADAGDGGRAAVATEHAAFHEALDLIVADAAGLLVVYARVGLQSKEFAKYEHYKGALFFFKSTVVF